MKALKTHQIAHISLNVAFIAIAAQITIPMGFVPFTLQVFALYLISMVNDKNTALYSTLVYIFIGFLGFPVFSGFKGGIMMLFSPTIGFIFGFIVLVWVNNHFKTSLIGFMLATVCLYTLGLLGLHLVLKYHFHVLLPLKKSIINYALVFLPTDFISYFLARIITKRLSKHPNVQFSKSH